MTAFGNSQKARAIAPFRLSWRFSLFTLIAGWIIVLALNFESSASLVRTWSSSALYGHGFFIIPVAVYLLWRRRRRLGAMSIRPTFWGLVGLAFFTFIRLIGEITATNALEHLGLIGMLQSLFLTVFGFAIFRQSLYALAYLFLAVPFGAGLIEPLQQLTASGTVYLVRLTGIPVHLDGFMLAVPGGRFHIAEACAGVRFLLSTFALAWLAGDILYISIWRRLIFLALAVIVPLIANTLRAYTIIVIASLRGLDASSNFDHVTYGLIFLGFVMLLLLLIGFSFRDRATAASNSQSFSWSTVNDAQHSVARLGALSALALVIIGGPPLLVGKANESSSVSFTPALIVPEVTHPWNRAERSSRSWRPNVSGPDAEIEQAYVANGAEVDLYIGYFVAQRQGAEVVNEETDWSGGRPWRVLGTTEVVVSLEGQSIDTPCVRIASGQDRRLVCHWYWVAQTMTGDARLAKLLQAWAWLFGELRSAALVAVVVPYDERPEAAVRTLQSFLDAVGFLNPLLVRVGAPE